MEPSSGAESEQIAKDETEEVAAEQAPEDSNVKEEEAEGAPEAAMADEAEGVPVAAMTDEAEGAPVTAMAEEAEGAPVTAMEEGAEGAPVAATEEEMGVAPVAAMEEEVEGAPVAAMEEEVEGAPVTATEEEVEGVPVAAMEEEVESAPVAATEEEVEGAPVSAVEEEVEGAPVAAVEEEVEGAPVAAMEEEVEGAPVAAVEEEVEGAPVAAMEEEVEGAPVAATEEEVEGAPVAATEEEVEGAPVAAMEEEVEGTPVAAKEEEEGAPVAAMEEEVEGAPLTAREEEGERAPVATKEEEGEGVPEASSEEEGEGGPMANLLERLLTERAQAGVTGEGILGEPSLSAQFGDVFPERTEREIRSEFATEEQIAISSESSETSSMKSDYATKPLRSGAARSVVFSPHPAVQLSSIGAMELDEDERELRFSERDFEEAEEETQLVVLDPEHPLMKRFQSALKAYLKKQMGKLTDDLLELTVGVKNNKKQREELGVILYGVQQQLARLQMDLEKNHNQHSQIAMARRQLEEELNDLRNTYRKTCQTAADERKKVSAMQAEMETLSLQLFYMQNMDQDVRDDIAVMKRTVKKAEAERIRAEVEKQKQDLYVDRLTRRADELQQQIALYEAQHIAQAEDSKITRQEVAEASTEIQIIHLEKKQLFHQWNVSLTGMKRRDEAYAAMQEALRESRHKLKSLEVEIEVYKKSISKEEERNELLASILNRSENDANMSRKLIVQSVSKQDAMKVEFGTYTRTLHETEQALSRINTDRAARMNDLVTLRRDIEKETESKQAMENEIMTKLQDQLMSNKAARYFLQLASNLQKKMVDLEMQFVKVENEAAQATLDITNTTCRLNVLEKILSELDKEMDAVNSQINHSEIEIAKRNLLIERKQGAINLFNKKLEVMISQLGGQELGPLEIEIRKLTKQIDDTDMELVLLQRHWLKHQKILVTLTQERDEQLESMDMQKKEITIKEQKRVRIENEIQQEKNELKDIKRHMKNMANDLEKLHILINKNSTTSEELQQGNSIMENEFVRSLKVSERESIEMQEKLDRLHEEKERLLNSLVEAEYQMMQWEKKIQIAKEMRAAVDSEVGQGEIRVMRAEIHRMQVRYSQLMKQQERMMRDMEAAVDRRENIVVRSEAQSKLNKQVLTKGDFYYKKQEMLKKIKEIHKNSEECNKIITQLEKGQKNLCNAIMEKQKQDSTIKDLGIALQKEVDQLQITKWQNLSDIVALQARLKHLYAVKEGRYNPLCRTELMIRIERQKLEERLHRIVVIIHKVQQEYPQHHSAFQKLVKILHNKLDMP